MSRQQQAQELFRQGHSYGQIAKLINTTWGRARSWADPDGDWRRPEVPKVCCECGGDPKPIDQFPIDQSCPDRHAAMCLLCRRVYRLEYQRTYRYGIGDGESRADKKYSSTELPRDTYGCPVCNCTRQAHRDRPGYGKYFQSQHEADQCCAGTVPIYRHSVLQTRGRFMMFNDRI